MARRKKESKKGKKEKKAAAPVMTEQAVAALAYQEAYERKQQPVFAFQVMNNSFPVPSAPPANIIYNAPACFPVDIPMRRYVIDDVVPDTLPFDNK